MRTVLRTMAGPALIMLLVGCAVSGCLSRGPAAEATVEAPRAPSDVDRQFIITAAGACNFHQEASRLAKQRTAEPMVLAYATLIGQHHALAADELRLLLSSLGQPWPDGVPAERRAVLDALASLPAEAFDSRFVTQIGIAEHEADVATYRAAADTLPDPGLRAWAARMVVTEQQHLTSARSVPVRNVAVRPH